MELEAAIYSPNLCFNGGMRTRQSSGIITLILPNLFLKKESIY